VYGNSVIQLPYRIRFSIYIGQTEYNYFFSKNRMHRILELEQTSNECAMF